MRPLSSLAERTLRSGAQILCNRYLRLGTVGALVVFGFRTSCAAGEVDPKVLSELRTTGVAAWKQLEEFQSKTSFSGSASQTTWYLDNDKKEQLFQRDYTCRVRRSLGKHCGLVEDFRPDGRHRVKVFNSEYGFRLQTDSDPPVWVLSDVGTAPQTPRMDANEFEWDCNAWQVNRGPSLELVVTRSDLFRIDEAVRISSDSTSGGIRLKATNLEERDREYSFQEHHGFPGTVYSVVVEPAKDWCIVQFETQSPRNDNGNTWTINGDIEYQDRGDGPVFPKKISLIMHNSDSDFDPDESRTINLENPEVDSGDSSEFYLPHYGIDDSAIRGDTRGRIWRFGYFAIGVAALVIAWRVLKGRSQSASV